MADQTLHAEAEPATPAGVHLEPGAALAVAGLTRAANRTRSVLKVIRSYDPFDLKSEQRAALPPYELAARDGLDNLLTAALNDLDAAMTDPHFEAVMDLIDAVPGADLYG